MAEAVLVAMYPASAKAPLLWKFLPALNGGRAGGL